ncbi:pyridoxal phosphate-dependent aminotransferase [Nitrincola tapanii]|uniref:Aminotransferase n=1 Tax=Nitrincola tapanii TaxID=1708751 RepID=A0A5A9W0B7_9GAMM|nr:pyridoxal phosphate-dependent aminotransferase [Nitrincola tapanii]KAA0873659.1 pyridoxal phosphate-dependent aminotransferase [Nitrincola tapanii]
MRLKASQRCAEVESFKVMDLLKRAGELEAQGFKVLHLEVGEPDFPTVPEVISAAQEALRADCTGYTPAAGLPQLRQAIAEFYAQHYRVQIAPEQVLVTPGASGALLLAFSWLTDVGDEVLMADPGYPCNRQFLRVLGAKAQTLATGPETAFQLTAKMIKEAWHEKTVGVLLASPSNPTGTLVSSEEMQQIAAEVAARGGQLLVDEIYQGLTYGVEAHTVLSEVPEAIVINSFSKYFGMTGWRLGWLIAPQSIVLEMEKLAQNLFISPPTVAQYAALAAFSETALACFEQRRHAFAARRDYLLAGLKRLGFQVPAVPEGAFYIYADASALTDDSFAFAWELLETCQVAITPGADFGLHQAGRYLRFAYTQEIEIIEEALQRLQVFLAQR